MLYELLVALRYIRRTDRSPKSWIAFALSLALFVGGAGLFFATPFKAVGAIGIVAGGVAIAAVVLLAVFTTFSAISILGVAIGVALLVWVLSVTSGFQEEFRQKVLGVNAHILVLKYGIDFAEYREVAKKAEQLPGVLAAAPFLFNEMMIARGNRLSGVLVKGIDPASSGRVLALPRHIVDPPPQGRAPPPPGKGQTLLQQLLPDPLTPAAKKSGELPGLVIGFGLASKLDVKVGDPVRLISPLSGLDITGWSAAVDLPRSRDFRIAAIFNSGFEEYDKRLVYLHMHDVQAFFDQGDVVTGVELKVRDVYRAPALARELHDRLGGSPYRTVDWSELNHNLFTALNIQKVFLEVVVGGFLAVVACFNIVAALAMLVIRKTREIAVLKSMGITSWGVARIFQSCGLIVWFFGTSLGLGAGYLGGLLLRKYGFPLDPKVYLISELPVLMDPLEFAITAALALLICLVATLYPSYRASRLHPVHGLHGVRG